MGANPNTGDKEVQKHHFPLSRLRTDSDVSESARLQAFTAVMGHSVPLNLATSYPASQAEVT